MQPPAGFDDDMLNGQTTTSTGVLFCKNSWGLNWGNQGHFKVAYGADGIISGDGNTYGEFWMHRFSLHRKLTSSESFPQASSSRPRKCLPRHLRHRLLPPLSKRRMRDP